LFIGSWFTAAETPMELVEAILSSLSFDLIYGVGVYLKWLVIQFVAASIWPTIGAIVITEAT
jgi:hypothetical protein